MSDGDNRNFDESEVMELLYRLDERTEKMEEDIEDQSVRLFQTKKNTQKNKRKIARLGAAISLAFALSISAAGAIFAKFLELVEF